MKIIIHINGLTNESPKVKEYLCTEVYRKLSGYLTTLMCEGKATSARFHIHQDNINITEHYRECYEVTIQVE